MNPQGQSIALEYGQKFADPKEKKIEYQEPHTGQAEPDAYQERYEKEFLKMIKVSDVSGKERYRLNLSYVSTGANYFHKRLLSGIQKVVEGVNKLPPVEFAYHLSGEKAGLMQVVTTSQGPQVSYTHTAMTIDGSDRDLTIEAPTGYAEPQTWIGPDYVVVAWRQFDGTHDVGAKEVKVEVYQWQGKWTKSGFTNIGTRHRYPQISIEANRYKDFQVKLAKTSLLFFIQLLKVERKDGV